MICGLVTAGGRRQAASTAVEGRLKSTCQMSSIEWKGDRSLRMGGKLVSDFRAWVSTEASGIMGFWPWRTNTMGTQALPPLWRKEIRKQSVHSAGEIARAVPHLGPLNLASCHTFLRCMIFAGRSVQTAGGRMQHSSRRRLCCGAGEWARSGGAAKGIASMLGGWASRARKERRDNFRRTGPPLARFVS